MNTSIVVKLATVSLMLGLGMVGCSAGQHSGRVALGSGLPKTQAEAASRAALKADAALKARDPAAAVHFAEIAVAGSPRDAGYRAILGQAYLLAGRFAAAETAFGDALALVPGLGRASLSMALAQAAQGDRAAAVATLDGITAAVPATDLGLAYAMAGSTDRALQILEPAARAEDAAPKARQNYALALALAGRWAEARATAAVDVSPADLDKRMAQWAGFTNPEVPAAQVAGLLGVNPAASDPGQPSQLALVRPEGTTVALAQAAPEALLPETASDVEAAVETASIAPSAAAPSTVPAEAPSFNFAEATSKSSTPFSVTEARPATPSLLRASVAAPARLPQATGGNFVVQLGAYSTADRVEIAWNRAMDRFVSLSSFAPASTTYVSTMRSATLYRLSISGFATHAKASELCREVKAKGGECFVRGVAGDAPVQWVSRKGNASA